MPARGEVVWHFSSRLPRAVKPLGDILPAREVEGASTLGSAAAGLQRRRQEVVPAGKAVAVASQAAAQGPDSRCAFTWPQTLRRLPGGVREVWRQAGKAPGCRAHLPSAKE